MDTNINCPVVEETVQVKKVSQKDAVYFGFHDAFTARNLIKQEGQSLKDLITKEIRKEVRLKLIARFKAGEISCKKTYEDKALAKYCSGLISNWLDKDKRYGAV